MRYQCARQGKKISYQLKDNRRKQKVCFRAPKGVSFGGIDEEYDDSDNCRLLTHGEKPVIQKYNTLEEELEFIVKEIKNLEAASIPRKDICIVARTRKMINGYKEGLRSK